MPLSYSLDHVGPLTRTVKDSALILQAIAGQDPNDPTTSYREVPDYLDGIGDGVKGMRIGVPENHCYDPVEDAVREPLEASLEVYRELGAEIVPLHAESIEAANRFANVVMATEAATYHSKWVRERPDDYGAQTLSRLFLSFYHSAPDISKGQPALEDFGGLLRPCHRQGRCLAIIPIEIPRIEEWI